MKGTRIQKLNSLLREVISEVIIKNIRDPKISKFSSVSSVEITQDLSFAKIFISVIGTEEEKQKTIEAFNQAAGFIGVLAAKKVTLRYFPTLTFELDTSVDKHMKIEKILADIEKEKKSRDNG